MKGVEKYLPHRAKNYHNTSQEAKASSHAFSSAMFMTNGATTPNQGNNCLLFFYNYFMDFIYDLGVIPTPPWICTLNTFMKTMYIYMCVCLNVSTRPRICKLEVNIYIYVCVCEKQVAVL